MNGICRLCGKQGPLAESHILPEFVYRPFYDNSHTSILIDLHRSKKIKRQKGFTQYLLCSPCETKFSKLEKYFSDIWFGKNRLRPISLVGEIIRIVDIDYAKFKLFHLSIIWRAGVASIPEFSNVRLGTQEPKLRKRLLEDNPGDPTDYPFYGIALRDPETRGFQDRILKAPDSARIDSHWIYALIFAGVQWNYCISSHKSQQPIPVYFTEEGILTLAIQDWTSNLFVRSLAKDIHKMMKRDS